MTLMTSPTTGLPSTLEELSHRSLHALRGVSSIHGLTLLYSQLNMFVCTKEANKPNRYFGTVLWRVNELCLERGYPRLTTLVINATLGVPHPEGMKAIGIDPSEVPAHQAACWAWGQTQLHSRLNLTGAAWHEDLPEW